MAKILVVDDDRDFADLISQLLKTESHTVDLCFDGRDALEMLQSYTFDAIVLDWQLPGMSGVEVLNSYRATGGKAPVLMLTGMTKVTDKATGLDCGADDYLTKPPHPVELSARVRALLRRAAGQASNKLTFKSLILDLNTHMVEKNGEKIDLLPREYAVIEFLVRHPNRIFSNEEIMDSVWPSDSESSPETVRGCIKRIRKKLDTEGEPSLIKNIYGVGYILES